MNNFSMVEPIIRDIKKLVNNLLTPHSPLDRIIMVCNRLLALKDTADLNKAMDEIRSAFDNTQGHFAELRALLLKLNSIGKS